MSGYRTVWVDKDGDIWHSELGAADREEYGPITECKVVPANAIVIERSELPEVRPDSFDVLTVDGERLNPRIGNAAHRQIALRFLAVSEYLREHPPVDEAQVNALTKALIDAEMDHPDGPVPAVVAWRLVQAGVRAPERAS